MTLIDVLKATTANLQENLDQKIQRLEQALANKDFNAFVEAHGELTVYEHVLFTCKPLSASKRTRIGGVCEKAFFSHIESDLNTQSIRLEFVEETDILFFYKGVKVATLYCGDSRIRFHAPSLLEAVSEYPESIKELETKLQVQKKKLFPFSSDALTEQEMGSVQFRIENYRKRLQTLIEQEDILHESLAVVPHVFSQFNIPVTNYG